MSFSNKFKSLFSSSEPKVTIEELENRIKILEGQLSVLVSTTSSLMETITQLVRGHVTNRQAIEELYNFATDPESTEDKYSLNSESEENPLTEEELEAYKKTLN